MNVRDVDGRSWSLLAPAPRQTDLLFFIATDCPISNRYVPEITRLCREYQPRGVRCFTIYPEAADAGAVKRHRQEYGIDAAIPAILDRDHRLVAAVGPRVTPEAAIYSPAGRLYRGRIDNLVHRRGTRPARGDATRRQARARRVAGRTVHRAVRDGCDRLRRSKNHDEIVRTMTRSYVSAFRARQEIALTAGTAETAEKTLGILGELGVRCGSTLHLSRRFRRPFRWQSARCFVPIVAQAQSTPTFARDVAPIVYGHCAVCHRPGQAAPFPLLSYDDVKKRGELIVKVTARRYMPPWHAIAAPGFEEFRDDRRLSDAELTTLRAWVDGGMPAGDLATAPQPPTFPEGWALGRPDVVLTLPRAIDVPADGPDLYRNVVLPLDLPEDTVDHGHRFRAERPQGGPPRVVLSESGGRLRRHSRRRGAARPRRRHPRRSGARAPGGRRAAGRRRSAPAESAAGCRA